MFVKVNLSTTGRCHVKLTSDMERIFPSRNPATGSRPPLIELGSIPNVPPVKMIKIFDLFRSVIAFMEFVDITVVVVCSAQTKGFLSQKGFVCPLG
jgi:hypothetical protein